MKKAILFIPMLLSTLFCTAQDKIPIDFDGKYKEATEHLNNFHFQKAVEALSFCHAADEKNVDVIGKMGYCYFQSGNFRDAKLCFQRVTKLDSLNINAISYLGLIAERAYDYKTAQNFYQQLIKIDSTNSYYFKQNGFTAKRRGDLLSAIGYFEIAHYLAPYDIDANYELSKAHIRIDNHPRADSLLSKAYKQDSTNIKILQTLGQLKYDLKELEESARFLEKMMQQGDSTAYFLKLLGNTYVNLEEFEQAVLVLLPILENARDPEMIHYYLALAYDGLENKIKSIEHYEKAIEAGISKNLPYYFSNLGTIYEGKKQFRKAINAFESAYKYSNNPESLFYFAKNCDEYYRDKKIAIRHYKKYLTTGDKKFKIYTEKRLATLKELEHFRVKN